MISHNKRLKYWMWFFLILGVLGIIELTTKQMVAESVMETYGREAAQLGLGLITGALLFDFEISAGLVTAVKIILDLSLIYFVFAALLFRQLKTPPKGTLDQSEKKAQDELNTPPKKFGSRAKVAIIIILALYIAVLIWGS